MINQSEATQAAKPEQMRGYLRGSNPTGYKYRLDKTKLPDAFAYYSGIEQINFDHPKQSGAWRNAICPFHADSKPSLRINMEAGGYRCMACGTKGADLIAFHMAYNSLSFVDACKDLGAWSES